MKNVTRLNPYKNTPQKGVSWRAILAGTVCVLSVMLLLNLFGIALGLGTINPTEESNPFDGIGTGSIIWWILSNLLALFAGGYVAARVGVSFANKSGIVQGIMTWALYTLFSAWLLTSVVGSILSGVGSVVSGVLSTAGNAVSQVVPDMQGQDQNSNQQLNISLEEAKQGIYALLEDADKPALDPDNIEQNVQQSLNQAQENARDAAASPGNVGSEIDQIFNNARNQFEGTFEALDKEALVNILTERTDMSESEAEQTVDRYIGQYENLRQQMNSFLEEAGQMAVKKSEQIAQAVADASLYLAIALVLGILVAAGGGFLGVKSLRDDYETNYYVTDSNDDDIHNDNYRHEERL